jgi:hypothetical protein
MARPEVVVSEAESVKLPIPRVFGESDPKVIDCDALEKVNVNEVLVADS